MNGEPSITKADQRFMKIAIALSRTHLGRTGTNPSVATLLVNDGCIVGRGITARGGRPHAEAQALAQAGSKAKGATAYVTLEPCAHHGQTPPCSRALVSAGIKRVVCALTDPDERVLGKGFAILQKEGVKVDFPCSAYEAGRVLSPYLNRSLTKQAQVTLKLALSADNMIGHTDKPKFKITGPVAHVRTHMLRANHNAVMIGSATAFYDDPVLTVRLPEIKGKSTPRIILDSKALLSPNSALIKTLKHAPVYLATLEPESEKAQKLQDLGVNIVACSSYKGQIALPELLEDIAACGFTSIFVEGGAKLAHSLLSENLVRRLILYQSKVEIGKGGIASPITPQTVPANFSLVHNGVYGGDRFWDWEQCLQV